MTWNYRIVHHHEPSEWFGLHKVFLNDKGEPDGFEVVPITFQCNGEEGSEGIIEKLERALAEAKSKPVLDETELEPESKFGYTSGSGLTILFSPETEEEARAFWGDDY